MVSFGAPAPLPVEPGTVPVTPGIAGLVGLPGCAPVAACPDGMSEAPELQPAVARKHASESTKVERTIEEVMRLRAASPS
jgi:hypothetical protein